MRLVFAGTPEFAVPALAALAVAGHHVALVLTQPDRPSGRGLALAPSAVKRAALARAIDVFQPTSLKDVAAQERIRAAAADAIIVAAYGLILPQAVLDLPRCGALNIHASLLPRWRGAAPIQRALLAGDRETGICIMQMDAGLDTGPVLLRAVEPIGEEDTAGRLHDRLALLGARRVVAALEGLERGTLHAVPQPSEGATYAPKIAKAEARIDWTLSAQVLERKVRAFDPVPVATAVLEGKEVKLWRARAVSRLQDAAPGEVLAAAGSGIDVACGEGALRILDLQRAGGRRLDAAAFLRGSPLAAGARFHSV